MTTPKDGGSAFPSCGADGCGPSGMSLRDYFAAKAMTAQIGRHDKLAILGADVAQLTLEKVAAACYNYADAMLAERSK